MGRFLFPALASASFLLSIPAAALDATYLKIVEPRGWHCTHEGQSWICAIGDLHKPTGLLEIKGDLLPPKTKLATGNARLVKMAGLEWSESQPSMASHPRLVRHQWISKLPTGRGAFVITIDAAYQPLEAARLDAQVTASLHTLRLSPHVLDYVDYLSVPAGQRDSVLPQVVTGMPTAAKPPACSANRRLQMTVGTGRMIAFPLRASAVAVIEHNRALEILAAHVPYVMSTLLFSPMATGNADVFVFDRDQKCRVHYAVGIQQDSSRTLPIPHEWVSQTIRRPSSAAEADAEYARLGTAIRAGHLESGNPAAAVPFPTDGTMWISDPRIFDTVRMKPEKDQLSQLALLAKHPGTTSLIILDAKGHGRGYRVTVDSRTMKLEPMALGQYESEL